MFNQALTLSAALLLWTSSVGAQQPHENATDAEQQAGMMANCMMQSGRMGEDMMDGDTDMMSGDMDMMSSSVSGLAMLMRMGPILDLTEKQVAELEAIQDELARAALDAKAVLTDEQRARLEDGMSMMRHIGSMGDGHMPGMSDQNSEDSRHEHGASTGGNLGG